MSTGLWVCAWSMVEPRVETIDDSQLTDPEVDFDMFLTLVSRLSDIPPRTSANATQTPKRPMLLQVSTLCA